MPPYVVFHDTVLRELARSRPVRQADLLAIKGVGEKKAADLGPLFLSAVADYCQGLGLLQDNTP